MSKLESDLALQFRVMGWRPEREYRFHPTRRWRFDFAFPSHRLAVEVEGLVYKGKGKATRLDGRHVTPKGIEGDMEKYNEAALLGWRLLRFNAAMVRDGRAIAYVERALKLNASEE